MQEKYAHLYLSHSLPHYFALSLCMSYFSVIVVPKMVNMKNSFKKMRLIFLGGGECSNSVIFMQLNMKCISSASCKLAIKSRISLVGVIIKILQLFTKIYTAMLEAGITLERIRYSVRKITKLVQSNIDTKLYNL